VNLKSVRETQITVKMEHLVRICHDAGQFGQKREKRTSGNGGTSLNATAGMIQ